jgi:hypothetical protein
MIFNFIKRAVIVPMLLTAVCVAGLVWFIQTGGFISDSAEQDSAVTYRMTNYKKFSDLDEGAYVGSIRYGTYEGDITFTESGGNALVLDADAKEPWEKGGTVILGSGAKTQLAPFRNAKVGDTLTLSLYSNDSYTYRIKKIRYGVTLDEIHKMRTDGLLVCRSYHDFSTANSKLYAVYTAEEVA